MELEIKWIYNNRYNIITILKLTIYTDERFDTKKINEL